MPDNTNNKANKIFITAFIAALLLPFLLYAIFGRFADKTNYENRALTSFADVDAAPLNEKPQTFENWLNDHAPFRNEFMTANAAINLDIFDTVQSGEVLLGKDDWLFYKNVSDSSSLDDYQGLNKYSDEQLAQIAADLQSLSDALAAKGTRFALVIAPNKEGVYNRFMPSSIPVVGETKADALVTYLAQNTTVPVIYSKPELQTVSEAQQVYYKYDTHWNEAGAFIAVRQLQTALFGENDAYNNVTFLKGGKTEKTDLANISATYDLLPDDYDYHCESFFDDITVTAAERDKATGYVTDYTSNAENGGKLFLLRDSFGSAMTPTLAKVYSAATAVHINAFEQNAVEADGADVFVWELAERNTDRLIDFLPRMASMLG